VFTPTEENEGDEDVFHVSMEQFFCLFQKAESELNDEKEMILSKMRPKNRLFGGCVDCAPCTTRTNDIFDEDYLVAKGI
jgi:hypothetical protein